MSPNRTAAHATPCFGVLRMRRCYCTWQWGNFFSRPAAVPTSAHAGNVRVSMHHGLDSPRERGAGGEQITDNRLGRDSYAYPRT